MKRALGYERTEEQVRRRIRSESPRVPQKTSREVQVAIEEERPKNKKKRVVLVRRKKKVRKKAEKKLQAIEKQKVFREEQEKEEVNQSVEQLERAPKGEDSPEHPPHFHLKYTSSGSEFQGTPNTRYSRRKHKKREGGLLPPLAKVAVVSCEEGTAATQTGTERKRKEAA